MNFTELLVLHLVSIKQHRRLSNIGVHFSMCTDVCKRFMIEYEVVNIKHNIGKYLGYCLYRKPLFTLYNGKCLLTMNWAELGITTVDTLVVRANVAFLHVSYRLKFRINLKGSLTTCMYDNPWVHRNREQPIQTPPH